MPNALSATDAIRYMKEGKLSSVQLVEACIKRIDETEGEIKAWARVDREAALARADEMDDLRKRGFTMGLLHGIPVGLKDIVDTQGIPTERGSPICEGRVPDADAEIVNRLLEAGAVILGKTKTTEFAFVHPTDTANPHGKDRSPGGSSSGSAAAVAAHQVPLAVGTQTNGSVIRPASFCGIYGFKPTEGQISRAGILQTSVTLDQVGGFARSLPDIALLSQALSSYDPADPASRPIPRPDYIGGAAAGVLVEPAIAWFDLPFDDRCSEDSREAMSELLEAIEPEIERIPAPPAFANLLNVQAIIHQYEFVRHLEAELTGHWDLVSDTLKPVVERGRSFTKDEYEDALDIRQKAREYFRAFFLDYDAIITPSSAGEAPQIASAHTGDPAFCTIWTVAGLPALNIPLLVGENGLPIGVQLVGSLGHDARLLRTANWLVNYLNKFDQAEAG